MALLENELLSDNKIFQDAVENKEKPNLKAAFNKNRLLRVRLLRNAPKWETLAILQLWIG